ncbi:MAG: EthD domain-containing protein [bacterium]|nr:EthD domain-containing protein [bacterium]
MIKLLSFKTRRPDLTPDVFRSHYEEHHVPLGLSFIEHFRWQRYVRNYVAHPVTGGVPFDCLTEFWVSARADQERTTRFVGSPEFSVLDADDRRFLDITRRLSFEVKEILLSESSSERRPMEMHRLSMFFTKPGATPGTEFAAEIVEGARVFAANHRDQFNRITLDLRVAGSLEDDEICAILSAWPSGVEDFEDLAWSEIDPSAPVIMLTSVETAREALFSR